MKNNGQIAVEVKSLSKTYIIRDKNLNSIRDRMAHLFSNVGKRKIKALRDINFSVQKGEIFGIIGHNGCGKSTLLKLILGAYKPDKGGQILVDGKIIRLSLGMGFDGNLTTRENVYINGSILGLSFKQIGQKFADIIEFAELQNFVDTKVRYFSSGMVSRLAFAIAINAEADVFLMDEFFGGVGDENFQKKSRIVLEDMMLKQDKTVIIVSHDLATIETYCNRVLLLDKGQMIKIGTPEEVIPSYLELMTDKVVVGGVS